MCVCVSIEDFGMHLNQGKFRKNGSCGYILKPESLRNRGMFSFKFLATWMKSNLNYNLAYHSPYFLTEKSQYHPMIKESTKLGKSCYFTIEVLSICFNLILSSFNFVLLLHYYLQMFSQVRVNSNGTDNVWLVIRSSCFLARKKRKEKKKESFLWRRVAKFPITLTFSYNLIE